MVMKSEAFLPGVMLPYPEATPMANAPLRVAALSTVSGVRRILIMARAIMNFMSPEGQDPGL